MKFFRNELNVGIVLSDARSAAEHGNGYPDYARGFHRLEAANFHKIFWLKDKTRAQIDYVGNLVI